MAEREGSSTAPWLAFLVGIVLVAIVGFGIFAYSGSMQPERNAKLEVNMPDLKVNPPDIDLPSPPATPAPAAPAEPAPANN